VEFIEEHLKLDPSAATTAIEQFLRDQMERMKREGMIIGLSGGLDSAIVAYLAVRSVGAEKVVLFNMPDRDSKARHQRDASLVAAELGARLQTQVLTPILDEVGIYDLLPFRFLPGRGLRDLVVRLGKSVEQAIEGDNHLVARFQAAPDSLVAKGNAYASSKHRLRMLLLYYHAEIARLMVVGAANKTELLTGTFVKWGVDQCADAMPIIHLYRSQLPALAAYLGIPVELRGKAADPDVMPGVDDKEKLLGSFAQTDRILAGLEHGVGRETLAAHFGASAVARVAQLYDLSQHMRESPYAVGQT
jgi:NAD+ synthase